MKSLTLILTLFTFMASAQSNEEGVKKAINSFFDGMRKSDSTLIRASLAPTALLQTITKNKEGKVGVATEKLDNFIAMISKPHTEIYDEQIQFETIKIDGPLAMAWTPYKFYIGTKFSHCGVNSFQLIKIGEEWKIQYIIDTRRREGCQQ